MNNESTVRRFMPWPESDAPEGWPTVYVAAEDYDLLRAAVRKHLDTFGYDNHEGLADALAGTVEDR